MKSRGQGRTGFSGETAASTAPSNETRSPATLPELAAKVKQIDGELAANKKAYNAYFLDNPAEVDQVRELLREDKDIPKKLAEVAEDWQAFVDKDALQCGYCTPGILVTAKALLEISAERFELRPAIGALQNVEARKTGTHRNRVA